MPEKQLGVCVWAQRHKCGSSQPRDREGSRDSRHLYVEVGETRPRAPGTEAFGGQREEKQPANTSAWPGEGDILLGINQASAAQGADVRSEDPQAPGACHWLMVEGRSHPRTHLPPAPASCHR